MVSNVYSIDAMSKTGAEQLANRIKQFWLETKGKIVDTWVVGMKGKDVGGNLLYCVRSNLYRGLPR